MSDTPTQDDIIDVEPKVIDDVKTPSPKPRRALAIKILPYVALALIAAFGGGLFYRDVLSGYFPSDQVQSLSNRLATFEAATNDNKKRVDAVVALTEEFKAMLSAAQAAADKSTKQNADTAAIAQNSVAEMSGLRQGFEKLSQTSAELQSQLAAGSGASSAAPDAALATRLALLEKQIAATAANPQGSIIPDLTVQLKTLKSQIAGGQNFATDLAPLARALPAAPGLDVLGVEREGLANAASLSSELDAIRASLPKPQMVPQDTSMWAGIKSLFSKLVRVRGQTGDEWATAAAKASAFAAAGDLDQASALFGDTNLAVPPRLKSWADKAQRRVKLEKATEVFAASLTRAGLAKE